MSNIYHRRVTPLGFFVPAAAAGSDAGGWQRWRGAWSAAGSGSGRWAVACLGRERGRRWGAWPRHAVGDGQHGSGARPAVGNEAPSAIVGDLSVAVGGERSPGARPR
jgi:hypothetical protein